VYYILQENQPGPKGEIALLALCCILRGPGRERIVDIVPGGTELELQLRRGFGQAAHTRNNPHVKFIRVY
jgi:hypothetical protein